MDGVKQTSLAGPDAVMASRAILTLDGWPGAAGPGPPGPIFQQTVRKIKFKVDFTIVKIHKWRVIYVDLFHSSSCWFHRSVKYYNNLNKKAGTGTGMIKSSFVMPSNNSGSVIVKGRFDKALVSIIWFEKFQNRRTWSVFTSPFSLFSVGQKMS